MKKHKIYTRFEDDRGSLVGIINQGCWKEINFVTSKKGVTRGGHYHKVISELFYIIEGCANVEIRTLSGELVTSFLAKKEMIFEIEPYEVHTFTAISDCQWINILSEPLNDKNKDIYQI